MKRASLKAVPPSGVRQRRTTSTRASLEACAGAEIARVSGEGAVAVARACASAPQPHRQTHRAGAG
jgi:hypothetical protein